MLNGMFSGMAGMRCVMPWRAVNMAGCWTCLDSTCVYSGCAREHILLALCALCFTNLLVKLFLDWDFAAL
jgi:hypothetical protein